MHKRGANTVSRVAAVCVCVGESTSSSFALPADKKEETYGDARYPREPLHNRRASMWYVFVESLQDGSILGWCGPWPYQVAFDLEQHARYRSPAARAQGSDDL